MKLLAAPWLFWCLITGFFLYPALLLSQNSSGSSPFSIDYLPELPIPPNATEQSGVAGAFSGIHKDVLIIAGGANFPGNQSWDGEKKTWHDHIYVLGKEGETGYKWLIKGEQHLPEPIAYGVSVSTSEGLICIGGDNGTSLSRKVWRLSWREQDQMLLIDSLPSLPKALAYMAGAISGNQIYIAGGRTSAAATKTFWVLDLGQEGLPGFAWKALPSWPGPERILAQMIRQSDGKTDALYLFGGRNVQVGEPTEVLDDAYRYDPSDAQWTVLPEMETGPLMAASASPAGAHHILFWGGARDSLFMKSEKLSLRIAETKLTDSLRPVLLLQQKKWLQNHPGFSPQVWAFNTITNCWSQAGKLPFGSPVTTNALFWGENLIIPSGEISPGVRTPQIMQIRWLDKRSSFGRWNYGALTLYLLLISLLGLWFSRRQKSTGDYFKGGGRIPWWAAGISIFGTMLSAITFMAIPAKTYATDWSYFMLNMGIILVAPLIAGLFIPFYHKLNLTSVYEYLEKRFNLLSRLLGSASFILFQLGRIGIVLLLPSIAIALVSGINVYICILVMGLISMAYTVFGGIEAVIWTDVLQVGVLLLGALLAIGLMATELEGGPRDWIALASQQGKLRTFDFRFDWSEPTFWVVLLGGIGASIITQGTDQSIVQRYVTSPELQQSRKSLYTNAVLTLPATLLFFSLGTLLYLYYQHQPEQLDPMLANNDAIFPWYIVTQLPDGVAGLLIAAIFSAAMSSLSSSMNSGATAFCKDFYQRFYPAVTDRQLLNTARISTLVMGSLGVLFALWMAGSEIKSLWDEFSRVLGLFTGGLGGVFLLGMITQRAHGRGAVIGILGSGIFQWVISVYTDLHFLLFSMTGILSCLFLGYVASLLVPDKSKPLKDLTLYD